MRATMFLFLKRTTRKTVTAEDGRTGGVINGDDGAGDNCDRALTVAGDDDGNVVAMATATLLWMTAQMK